MDEQNRQHEETDAERTPEGGGTDHSFQAPSEEPIAQAQQTHPTDNRQAMSAYERSSRRSQWAIALVTTIYVIFVGLQWYAMKETLILTRDSIDLARQTLLVTNRPWVSASVEIAGPLFMENNSPGVRLKITLKNPGHSPATSIVPFPIMTGHEQQPMNMLEMQKRRCSTINQPPGLGGGLVYTLFPGDTVEEYNTPSIAREEIESIGFNIVPLVIICVNYKLAFSGETHQTVSVYMLGRVDPTYPDQTFTIDLRASPIPAASLHLIPMGSYAD